MGRLTLNKRMYLQFAIVGIPVFALLLYLVAQDLKQSAQLRQDFEAYEMVLQANKNYGVFINSVTDAVDTGKLSAKALEKIVEARRLVIQADTLDGGDRGPGLSAALFQLEKELKANSELATLTARREQIRSLAALFDSTVTEGQGRLSKSLKHGTENAKAETVMVGAMGLLALAVGLYSIRMLVRGVNRPLAHAIAIADRIAQGDLNNRVEIRAGNEIDDLLQSLATMNDKLRELIGSIAGASSRVRDASGQMLSDSKMLSERNESQASTLQQTSASIEELTATVNENAESARQSRELADTAAEDAVNSGEVVKRLGETMGRIEASSNEIANITAVIDGIAFQTNILALNAAVESAHAGEHGKGFAVVASEVRSLSQRCATAAKEIKALIETSTRSVATGGKLAQDAGASMRATVDRVQQVAGLINRIAQASGEQASGIGQLNQAMNQLEQMTQRNAAVVDSAARLAGDLDAEAVALNDYVRVFRLGQDDTTEAESVAAALARETPPASRPLPPRPPLGNKDAAQDNWTEF